MPGVTFVDCRLTWCLRWEACKGKYPVKGPELLGVDERGKKHYLCKNYVEMKCNKMGCVPGQEVPRIEKAEQKTLF